MYFYRLLSLVLLAVLTGCISMPLGGDYNTSEWQENRIQLSDVTVSFEAPKHSESFPRPVLIDEVDIFDESLYINSYLQCVKLMWTFTPQRGVNGDLMLKIIVVKYPGNGNRKSVREIIESTMENSASKRNIPVSSRIKNRYKYAAQFSADGPTWLMYDYGSAPTNAMRDYYERCLYPLDEEHYLVIGFEFVNNTRITPKNPKKFQPWYNEAQTMADRILTSTRIERAVPKPDIDYGVPYLGVINSNRIVYVDSMSERPPIPVLIDKE